MPRYRVEVDRKNSYYCYLEADSPEDVIDSYGDWDEDLQWVDSETTRLDVKKVSNE